MKILLTLIIIMTSLNESIAQLEFINASVEIIQIDSIGNYSDITLYQNGKYIGATGSYYTFPNWVAYSSDYGSSWFVLDVMDTVESEIQGTDYSRDFEEIYFNNNQEVIVFSNKNKFFIYGELPIPSRDEYLLRYDVSFGKGRSLDYICSQKIDEDYYVYSRWKYGFMDESTITVLNSNTLERRFIKFDMLQFAKLTEPRGEEKYETPRYNDELITKDKCFFATISNLIDIGEEYPIWVKSLAKVVNFDKPQWEVFPLRFTDSTALQFIYFDDCQNGFLSTYKSHNKNYSRVFKTTDGGESWEKIYEDNKLQYVLRAMKRANDSTLFALSGLSSIYRSTNNGYNWSRIESNSKKIIRDYEIIDEKIVLLAHDENILTKLTINETTGIVQSNENDIKDLNLNYKYIEVYDLSGQKLFESKSDNKNGLYDLTNGLYLKVYKDNYDNIVRTDKLIITK